MLKLLRGEIYRLLHKKSMYIYFGALAVAYVLISYIRSGEFGEGYIVVDAGNYFEFLPALVGGFLFAAIYTDDLSSKSLITLVGFGLGKVKIVLAKFILMALFGTVVFGLIPLLLFAVHAVFGWVASVDSMMMVYALALKALLVSLAFAALSGIVAYGLQRTTFAMVLYILLTFNIVSGLIATVLNLEFISSFLPNLSDHLMSGISRRMLVGMIGDGSLMLPAVEYIIYVIFAIALSVLAFRKKEMEF